MTGCNREGGKGRNEGSPPRPSVPPKLASLASFPEPPPQRTAVLPSKNTLYDQNWRPLLPFQKPPPPPPSPPPPKGQLFCPPRPSVRQNWRPFASFPEHPPPTQRTAVLPSKALCTTKTGVLCFLSRTPPHTKDSCFALQGPLYDQNWRPLLPCQNPPPHPKDSCFALQGPLYHQNWRPLLPPFLKLPKPDPPPPERPEPEAALCCYRRAAGQSQNTAVSS